MASRLAVFLAFVQLEHIEFALEALSVHIAGIHPELMAIVNYFEQTYLGLAQPFMLRSSEFDYQYGGSDPASATNIKTKIKFNINFNIKFNLLINIKFSVNFNGGFEPWLISAITIKTNIANLITCPIQGA